jgi:hypothetical protein
LIQPSKKPRVDPGAVCVATRWRHSLKEKPLVMSGFSKTSEKTDGYLVAGIGFEPMTFRL